ncbi:MAG: serine--tRNA ligase [bacterium]|nr:serine--tRNA ligase [bacterium]
MLDLKFILKNPDLVKQACQHKNLDPAIIDEIIKLAGQHKKLLRQIEDLRAQKNKLDRTQIEKARQIKTKLKTLTEKFRSLDEQLNQKLAWVPNLPADDVPIGKDEAGNLVLYEHGQKPKFNFTPKTHHELGELLDIIDTKRGAKVSGFRGYFLKNEGALLHLGILMYALQKLVAKGFIPIVAPAIVKRFVLFGSGQFPWGERETYKLNDKDAYLAGTAEQPMMAYFSGETLKESELPIKLVAFSPCYRREAGSYGKDTRGVYRVHEFMKVEQLVIDTADPAKADQWIEELKQNSEEILNDLNLPYRVLKMCTGDMGEPHHKKYDIETWMPGRGKYGETMSDSIMTDFQTRRLKIYYQTKQKTKQLAYSYNNTAIASPRILVAILENYQTKNGEVIVPKVLRPFVGTDIIKPKK